MRSGASLLLIAVGAILKFGVTRSISGINLSNVGIILMLVGGVGLVVTGILMSTRRRTDVIEHRADGTTAGTTYLAPSEDINNPLR